MNEEILFNWFKLKKWDVLPFQLAAWHSILEGKSGLISVPTGAGKTYAAYLPALEKIKSNSNKGIKILYITPLRALASDVEHALNSPIKDLNLPLKVAKRTGDTSFSLKKKQAQHPPDVLLTIPESLSLLLTDSEARKNFSQLEVIIIDEWHELLSSKRGYLTELSISRLKTFVPSVQIWGLSATLANLEQAAQACVGLDREVHLITAKMKRDILIHSILPKDVKSLPWAGYLGLRMFPLVLDKLDLNKSTIIFTNTRSQAERWFLALLEHKPDWKDKIALHHSSIDKKEREKIESGLKNGEIKIAICTSSLDLGIDFPLVERVIQIGSPKSISRLIQRAGRASHKPLTPCEIYIVPTHALEVLELKAYREATDRHLIEKRYIIKNAYDVLLQHLTTCAIGGGFNKEEMYQSIKTTACFNEISKEKFESCLLFLQTGGTALEVYPEYKKLIDKQKLYVVEDKSIIRRHKMNIGTITSDSQVAVRFMRGKTIGLIEESFLTQLKPGDLFLFAGKILKLMQYRDLTAYVSLASKNKPQTVTWRGSRLPFSAPLGEVLRNTLFIPPSPTTLEENLISGILELQEKLSYLPKENEILIEILKTREGHHLFVYPFEGKIIHEGLARLVAHRLSLDNPATFTISYNDYGFEILSKSPFPEKLITNSLFAYQNAKDEYFDLINLHELAKTHFREIAKISGLVFSGYPHKHKSNRQLQISTSLLFEVLDKYDSGNLLVEQAKEEVLEKQFEHDRLIDVLKRLYRSSICYTHLIRFSPFSLPLYIERVGERLSTETLDQRLQNIQKHWKTYENNNS